MWHIIPPEKLTDDYLARLAYNVGVSQQLRARRDGRYAAAVVREGGKWCATLVLACTMRPCRAVRLLRMRYRIACGLFASLGRE